MRQRERSKRKSRARIWKPAWSRSSKTDPVARIKHKRLPEMAAVFILRKARSIVRHRISIDRQVIAARRYLDRIAVPDCALEDTRGERVLQIPLDHPLQRPGAVNRII